MARADKIAEIIEKRRDRAQKLDCSHAGLRSLSIILEELETLRKLLRKLAVYALNGSLQHDLDRIIKITDGGFEVDFNHLRC